MKKEGKKSIIREYLESIIIALVLAMLVRTFVVQAFKIPTGSMRPTLMEGDRILVNKFIYGAKVPFIDLRLPDVRQPKRGDIIVFKYPEDPKRDFIKRLIATEGEEMEIVNGNILINGKVVDKPDILRERFYYNRGEYGKEGLKIKVPPDSFYVLGDNSATSRDSRYWGFVPKKDLIGKAFFIYWPLYRIRLIK
jgi:signal peptidase I